MQHIDEAMQNLNIREMRSLLGKLDSLVGQELIIPGNKQAIARILPIQPPKQRPSHADFCRLQQQRNATADGLFAKAAETLGFVVDVF